MKITIKIIIEEHLPLFTHYDYHHLHHHPSFSCFTIHHRSLLSTLLYLWVFESLYLFGLPGFKFLIANIERKKKKQKKGHFFFISSPTLFPIKVTRATAAVATITRVEIFRERHRYIIDTSLAPTSVQTPPTFVQEISPSNAKCKFLPFHFNDSASTSSYSSPTPRVRLLLTPSTVTFIDGDSRGSNEGALDNLISPNRN